MSSETHTEDAAPIREEGVVVDAYGWYNLHKLSMCLAAAYVVYYLLVIVRVRLFFFRSVSFCLFNSVCPRVTLITKSDQIGPSRTYTLPNRTLVKF